MNHGIMRRDTTGDDSCLMKLENLWDDHVGILGSCWDFLIYLNSYNFYITIPKFQHVDEMECLAIKLIFFLMRNSR